MNYEEIKKYIAFGHKVYAYCNDPTIGYLDFSSLVFGTRLDNGILRRLMDDGIIRLNCVINGIGEFIARK